MKGARILIVDDEPIRLLLGQMFRLVGFEATEVASGEEALLYLEEELYDLMLLDINLPGKDGIEILYSVHKRWPNLLVIILTGFASLDNAIHAIRSQVVDYLQKPVTFEEVHHAVTDALARHEVRLKNRNLMELVEKYPELLSELESETSPSPPIQELLPRTLFVEPLLLNRTERSVRFVNQPNKVVTLTKGEMAVLSMLMSYPNKILSCKHLVQGAWNYETSINSAKSVIRPYVSRLRKKLEKDAKKPTLIRTVRNQGYMFTCELV